LPKVDFIIHLAAKSYVPDAYLYPEKMYSNNINTTLNVLEKARRDGAKVIFLSTYVYGVPLYLPIDESHEVSPQNPYTQSKLICEQLCEAYYRDFGVPTIIFRPFNIFGPGQNLSFLIPTLFSQINKNTIVLKDSRPKRDFIYVQDIVDALLWSISNKTCHFDIYNLGSGTSHSIGELVSMVREITNSESIVEFTNEVRKGEVLDTVADCSKFRLVSSWKPRYDLKSGLEKYYNATYAS
jgi:nucleoside-diphosphate-sugar epimerase